MLARHVEAAGIPTVVVTMMPATAVALVSPRWWAWSFRSVIRSECRAIEVCNASCSRLPLRSWRWRAGARGHG